MSSSYDRYERNARTQPARHGLTYWIPLVLTVTVATAGVAAWIWSERSDDDEDAPREDRDRHRGQQPYGRNPDGSVRIGSPSYADVRPGEVAYGTTQQRQDESQGYMARMSGALRRTPSPQQFMEGASRSVAAGVAAAGAVVGSALSSIREEDRNAFKDHKTWSEEVDTRHREQSSGPIETRSVNEAGLALGPRVPVENGKRKTVAIVVSADINEDGQMDEDDVFVENASILSHLPRNTDFSKIRLFVLIYAPGLKEHPLDIASRPPGSLSSSFSNIGHDQAQTPTEEANKTIGASSNSPAFEAIYSQGLSLVEKETMVLPFTTLTGHVHILRHLNPEIVYLQEYLTGNNGDVVTHLQTWLRQDVVVVVGADKGSGGLVDSESEAEAAPKKAQKWWEKDERVGRGRGVVLVDGIRVGDDWERRVQRRE
ncbi:hypothetical protein BJ878DRAFT_506605 [Calycina marina]|uniref:Peroxin 22-like protein n=1 Tax=Calycina marina TaxID=1763456 RepID=A0A9P7Z2I1_9HELO|nr:hypothetical protein BJ878DRAFT_506605 [Calycina marina]